MNKNNVINEAIAAIPAWLSFLDIKESEQQAILAEIQQQGTEPGEMDIVDTAVSPLSWLDEDVPPPDGEPQAPLAYDIQPEAVEAPKAEEDTPPWGQ
jgi:hypothetical protein